MKLRIPRADALAIGTALTAAIVIVNETPWEHWVKQLVIAAIALVSAIVVSPAESEAGVSSSTTSIAPVAGATQRPTPPPSGTAEPL